MKSAMRNRSRSIWPGFAILMSFAFVAVVASVHAQNVSFADANLELAVEQQLGIPGLLPRAKCYS